MVLTFLANLPAALETSTTDAPQREILWTDTLTAVGTVGAVVLSLGLAIVGWVTAAIERRKRRASEASAVARAQAEQGHWWHELCSEHPLPWDSDLSLSRVYEMLGLDHCWGEVLVLENMSGAPMHDVVVNAPSYLLPGLDTFMLGSLGPHDRRVFHISGFGTSLLDPRFDSSNGWISFADAGGRRWRRTTSGALEPSTTTRDEDQKAAEGSQRDLFATLTELGSEALWVDIDGQHLSRVKQLILSAPERRSVAMSRYFWQQLHRADDLAFRILQRLPRKHWKRRAAEEWWTWRSGRE